MANTATEFYEISIILACEGIDTTNSTVLSHAKSNVTQLVEVLNRDPSRNVKSVFMEVTTLGQPSHYAISQHSWNDPLHVQYLNTKARLNGKPEMYGKQQ
jgi:hypothetical protein